MKVLFFGVLVILLFISGCVADNSFILDRSIIVNEIDNSKYYDGLDEECTTNYYKSHPESFTQTEFEEEVPEDLGSFQEPLYFTIGVHIEAEPYASGIEEVYEMNLIRLRKVADIVEKHNGKMTVQTQRPFTTYVKQNNETIFRDLADSGHEMALHIHENYMIPNYLNMAYPGKDEGQEIAEAASYAVWLGAVTELKEEVEDLSGSEVRSFSGAPWFEERYELMSELGITVNYNYKDPEYQQAGEGFQMINPWRPLSAESYDTMLQYDRNGNVIYIPSGVFPTHCSGVESLPHPYSYESFDYVTKALIASLNEVDEEKINAFSILFHPIDFGDVNNDVDDLELWDEWLTEVIDPLVEDGKIEWATFIEVGDMYEIWEEENVPSN